MGPSVFLAKGRRRPRPGASPDHVGRLAGAWLRATASVLAATTNGALGRWVSMGLPSPP